MQKKRKPRETLSENVVFELPVPLLEIIKQRAMKLGMSNPRYMRELLQCAVVNDIL